MAGIIATLVGESWVKEEYGQEGRYFMPLYEKVDPAIKKGAQYCRDMAASGFASLIKNRTALPGTAYSYMQLLRSYGQGAQSEDYYINQFKKTQPKNTSVASASGPYDTDGVWTQTAKSNREGLGHINTRVTSPATNIKNGLHGIFSSYDESIYINSIDNDARSEENRKMYEALFEAELAEFTGQMQEEFGVQLASGSNLPEDISLEELEVYRDLGGFKSEWAVAMEEFAKYTEIQSDWDDNIKRKWVDDLFDLNMIAGRCVYDTEINQEQWRYIDPANFVIQYSKDRNFKDSEFAGYFTLEKLSKLVQKGFDSDQLRAAAQKYEHLFGNYQGIRWKELHGGILVDDRLNDFLIPVFHFEWIDCDVERTLKVKNEYGRENNFTIEFDKEVKPVSDYLTKKGVEKSVRSTRIRRTYMCSWIVDTDMVYDYGICPNQARKSTSEPMLSMVAWRGMTTSESQLFGSVIESIIPYLDALQLAWLKHQDALVKSHPGGYGINLRLLQNLEIEGKAISPLDAFEMFWQTGRFPYLDVPIGQNYSGGDVLPLRRIEGNLGELMVQTSQQIHFNLAMIEKITGINPAPLGSTPAEDTPVTTQQMAVSGTNNVLRPFINGMFKAKERLADCSIKRYQLAVRNIQECREKYIRVFGDRSVEVVIDAEREGREYGLYAEARPEAQEVQSLMQAAEEALAPGRDGKTQIDLSQYMYIFEQIRSGGNIKKLTRDLSFMIRKKEEENQKRQQENIQLQIQQQQALEQQKMQNEAQIKQMDTQSQVAIDQNKQQGDMMLQQIKDNAEYEQIILKAKLEKDARSVESRV